MMEETSDLREKLAAVDARLECLQETLGEVAAEMRHVARLVRGNGEEGLAGQVRIIEERCQSLEKQWKWYLWLLAGFVLAMVQAYFRK